MGGCVLVCSLAFMWCGCACGCGSAGRMDLKSLRFQNAAAAVAIRFDPVGGVVLRVASVQYGGWCLTATPLLRTDTQLFGHKTLSFDGVFSRGFSGRLWRCG